LSNLRPMLVLKFISIFHTVWTDKQSRQLFGLIGYDVSMGDVNSYSTEQARTYTYRSVNL